MGSKNEELGRLNGIEDPNCREQIKVKVVEMIAELLESSNVINIKSLECMMNRVSTLLGEILEYDGCSETRYNNASSIVNKIKEINRDIGNLENNRFTYKLVEKYSDCKHLERKELLTQLRIMIEIGCDWVDNERDGCRVFKKGEYYGLVRKNGDLGDRKVYSLFILDSSVVSLPQNDA